MKNSPRAEPAKGAENPFGWKASPTKPAKFADLGCRRRSVRPDHIPQFSKNIAPKRVGEDIIPPIYGSASLFLERRPMGAPNMFPPTGKTHFQHKETKGTKEKDKTNFPSFPLRASVNEELILGLNRNSALPIFWISGMAGGPFFLADGRPARPSVTPLRRL
jgi:hypothetical protein